MIHFVIKNHVYIFVFGVCCLLAAALYYLNVATEERDAARAQVSVLEGYLAECDGFPDDQDLYVPTRPLVYSEIARAIARLQGLQADIEVMESLCHSAEHNICGGGEP